MGGGTDFSLRRAEARDADRSLPTALLCAGAVSLLRSCVLLVPAARLLSRLLSVTGVWLSFVVTEAACCALSLCSVRAVQRG